MRATDQAVGAQGGSASTPSTEQVSAPPKTDKAAPKDGSKKGKKEKDRDAEWVAWVKTLMDEGTTDEADPREFMKTFRTDLFDEEVHVFTPKGQVKTLPAGSIVYFSGVDIKITSGKAAATFITVDGRTVGAMGTGVASRDFSSQTSP